MIVLFTLTLVTLTLVTLTHSRHTFTLVTLTLSSQSHSRHSHTHSVNPNPELNPELFRWMIVRDYQYNVTSYADELAFIFDNKR
jgi:hypothetical protein